MDTATGLNDLLGLCIFSKAKAYNLGSGVISGKLIFFFSVNDF